MQNFVLVTTLYDPSTWCTDSGIVHLIKLQSKDSGIPDLIKGACEDEHSHFMQNINVTFILTGYGDVLRISVFVGYE